VETSTALMTSSGSRSKPSLDERDFQRKIVHLISGERDPEGAIRSLSEHYKVEEPSLKMGLPRGTKKALGCYVHRERTIYISKEEFLYDPYVVIHEFYHHLRNVSGKHRGTERHAKEFALEFLRNT